MYLDPRASLEDALARRLVSLGDIFVAPAFWRQIFKTLPKRGANEFLRPLPDHEWRRVGVKFDHWNAEDEAVEFAQETPPLGALAQQAVDMRGIAVAPVAQQRIAFAVHRQRVTRVADRNLGRIPGKAFEPEFGGDEIDRLAA